MKKLIATLAVAFLLPICLPAQVNQGGGAGSVQNPGNNGAAILPHVTQTISGKGDGNGVGMPEKGNTITSGSAFVAWDEDVANGRFDCRNPAYAGGCLGPTPGLAMQAFSDRLICYQGMTGKHAHVQFPPGTIIVGTDAHPTLKLPGGAIYEGGGGWGFGTNATQFQSTYNNRTTFEVDDNLTSTTNCSDGSPHTSTLNGGSFDGISQHGCGQGGCHNVPGDSGNYPIGGPLQIGGVFQDAQMSIGQKAGVFANNNGGDGLFCGNGVTGAGLDSHCYELGGAANNGYFYFGMDVAGQNYQFSAGECHADVVLNGLDAMNEGPFEVYGTFMPLGWEYGHIAGICWGGGLTNLGHVFSQIEEIGIIHMAGGNQQASADSVRIDAPRGDGILDQGNGQTTWSNPRVISACRFDGAGTNSWLVYSVATATPGSAQTPGTYLLTGSDGHSQISVTVAAGGTVTATPIVTVHNRGMTSAPPTYTLAAGGTPATFTATMAPVFALLHTSGTPFAACDYVDDQSGGKNVWVSPLMINNGFFGASFATGDIASIQQETWIYPQGNNGGGGVIWEPGLVAGAFKTADNQRVVNPDAIHAAGGTPNSGSTINIYLTGGHVQLNNGSPTTLTAITNGTMMSDLWLTGDGFTTMPEFTVNTVFGGKNCSTHDLLFAKGQLYHYLLTNQDLPTLPAVYTEQCESTFQDYLQPGFNWLATHSALPVVDTQATMDVAGSYAVRPYPVLPTLTVSVAGGASSFNYCYAVQVWVAGGKQTSASVCNPHTPPVSFSASDNVFLHLPLPQNWTRFKVYMNSTTDPAFTPGVWWDISTPNSLPQPATTDFLQPGNTIGGLPIQVFAPTDTSVIATANLSLNMTGTYNDCLGCVAVPASSNTLGIKGQKIRDIAGGFDYECDAEDHWKRAAITWANF